MGTTLVPEWENMILLRPQLTRSPPRLQRMRIALRSLWKQTALFPRPLQNDPVIQWRSPLWSCPREVVRALAAAVVVEPWTRRGYRCRCPECPRVDLDQRRRALIRAQVRQRGDNRRCQSPEQCARTSSPSLWPGSVASSLFCCDKDILYNLGVGRRVGPVIYIFDRKVIVRTEMNF